MMDDQKFNNLLLDASYTGQDPAGKECRFLSFKSTTKLAAEFQIPHGAVELAALQLNIVPERYQRSFGTIGFDGQNKLLKSTVAVIGNGGLGGFVIEMLARMGVGKIIAIDGDCFTDSNLNRQLLATEKNIGRSKAEAAVERVALVNSSTVVDSYLLIGTEKNLPPLLKDCNLVVDCLDNLPSRFDLEKVCSRLNLVLVHGAIAGMLGQIAVIRPGKPLLESIYGKVAESGITRGVEVQLGNPATTPAMLAAWQVSEAVKYLAGLDGVLPDNNLLIIDMQSAESYKVEVAT
jgi:molybdopterin-synthase adenylyltransferase